LFLTIVSTAQAQYSGGTGEPNDPYQIATAEDLMLLGETPEDYDKHFILTTDIDLYPNLPGRKVFDKAVIPSIWGTYFAGFFDGGGHTISNLTIRGEKWLGLFGGLESGAEVKNLGLMDASVTGSGDIIGGLVGMNKGTLTQCYSIGIVHGGSDVGGLVGYNEQSVIQCFSIATVIGKYYVGGLAGGNSGAVTLCSSRGEVSADMESAGGLIGDNVGAVTQCSSDAEVKANSIVGGLVGRNEDMVTQCFSTGAVEGASGAGGLVGSNHWSQVTDCYSTGNVKSSSYAGGLVGGGAAGGLTRCYCTGAVSGDFAGGLVAGPPSRQIASACFWDTEASGLTVTPGGAGKTTAEMQTASTFLEAGWDYVGETTNGTEDIWKIAEGIGYPRLAWQKYSGGTGDPNDPYQIATAADLIALGESPEDYDKHFILTADINLDPNLPGRKVFDRAVIAPDTSDLEPDFQGTPFTGVFDGNAYKISHLTIVGDDYMGLFGYISGEVRDLGVVDVNPGGSGVYVGALAGINGRSGVLSNCHSTGVFSGNSCVGALVGDNLGYVTECYSTGTVSGNYDVGGLVGVNWGDVTKCYSTSIVTGEDDVGGLVGVNEGDITECYSTSTVTGEDDVGGLVGVNEDSIMECYSISTVNGYRNVGGLVGYNEGWEYGYGNITSSYSSGAVRGDQYVGGLVGDNSGVMADCYSADAVIGTKFVGGLVGRNNRSITQSYSAGSVSGTSDVGGLVGIWTEGGVTTSFWDIQTSGQSISAGGVGLTTAEMQNVNMFISAGWDFVGQPDGPHDIWAEPEDGGYPILWWQQSPLPKLLFSGGTGEPSDPYVISTAEQLNSIGYNPRLMECHFRLANDLDLTGLHFYSIGPYRGVFDGNGHTVSHLNAENAVLFDKLDYDGEIRNLGVVDVNIVGIVGSGGGMVGVNCGNVTQCYTTGIVSGSSNVDPSYSAIGGLVGENYGNVTFCYSTCAVEGSANVGGLVGYNYASIASSYSTGAVSGNCYVGGLVGINFFAGRSGFFAVAGGTISNCYSRGMVDGNEPVGGLVGYSMGPADHISGFWDIQTSGQTVSLGGSGKTTAEMQTTSTFLEAGWDFVDETANGTEDIWWILEGQDYPRLWWETK